VAETMAPLPAEDPRIVLNHNPDTVFDIAGHGADLILSGHTHGGQVDLPIFGPPLLPVTNRQYYSGLYQVDERTRLSVSNGLGYLIRVRFNARPEIVVYELAG
jgi:predicted MPP superfamily phosphohydrolase